jgi:hypothetical protein
MTVRNPPPDFVIRLGDVVIERLELAKALESELDRYGRSRDGSSNYAQISLPGDASEWQKIAQFLDEVGPRIKALIDQRLVGSASIDFAVRVKEGTWAQCFTVPATVAEKAGRHSIEIELSVYRAEETD